MALRQKDEQKEFRKLIEEMYRGFPNTVIHEDEIKKVIKTEKVRENFQKYGFMRGEGHGNVNYYALGPNSINLISNWRLETLNHRMIVMECSSYCSHSLDTLGDHTRHPIQGSGNHATRFHAAAASY
jgi:hypothetical protein